MQFDLDKFKELYQDEFGENLSDEELERKSRMLFNFYKALYGSVPDILRQSELNLKNPYGK
jgi:hypothetical protein